MNVNKLFFFRCLGRACYFLYLSLEVRLCALLRVYCENAACICDDRRVPCVSRLLRVGCLFVCGSRRTELLPSWAAGCDATVCSAEVSFSHLFLRDRCAWKAAACFLTLLVQAAMFECERGYIGENIWGRRKPRTDVSGADIEEKKKENILLVVLAVKAWNRARLFYVCFSYLYSAEKICILYMAI